MRVLVCGGRDYDDREHLYFVLNALRFSVPENCITLVEGCAPGADSMAEHWAKITHQDNIHFPADWNRYGKAAGMIRNRQMLVESQPDLVVAFPGGRGTAGMIRLAMAAGVRVVRG